MGSGVFFDRLTFLKNTPRPHLRCDPAALFGGCGKKGPPLPPLVRVPTAPPEIAADRRAGSVDVRLIVPASNTDGSRPANISRVDVYAVTSPLAVSDADLLKYGTRIGSLQVKAPRDPNDTIEPDDSDADLEPLEGPGLDQGATAHVKEELSASALKIIDLSSVKRVDPAGSAPLAGPPSAVPSRMYVAVGVNKSGRRGPLSKRVAVPLIAPPPPGSQPDVTYDEHSIALTWTPAVVAAPATLSYNVYDVRSVQKASGPSPTPPADIETKLPGSPVTDPRFVDPRIEWGAERCYTVSAIETIDGLTLEGDPSPSRCVTLVDTFPPAAPSGLQAIASPGVMRLIWDGNSEKDLAGYLVLRRTGPDGAFAVATPTPIPATNFDDAVQAGVQVVYVVQAVDKAGNTSPMSKPTDAETAR